MNIRTCDPQFVGQAILETKQLLNCSILDAADRVFTQLATESGPQEPPAQPARSVFSGVPTTPGATANGRGA